MYLMTLYRYHRTLNLGLLFIGLQMCYHEIYGQSDSCWEQRVNALKQLASENPAVTNKELNKKNIEAFYILNGEYIDGTKKTIEEDYGSFEKYLESIGVQKEIINDINQILLE